MAVSTTDTYSGPYTANGVTVEFPFTFKAVSVDDVGVFIRDANGNDSLINPASYTVSLVNNGGTVLFSAAPASGSVYVLSEPSFLQEVEFASGQPFLPTVVNGVNDRDVVRALYLRDAIRRSPQIPIGGGATNKFPFIKPDGGWGFSNGTGADDGLRQDLADEDVDKGGRLVRVRQALAGSAPRLLTEKLSDVLSVKDFGAIGDRTYHPVSEWLPPFATARYANLAAIQADYPHVDDLTDSIDWAAIQAAVDNAGGKELRFPAGGYYLNREVLITKGVAICGERNRSTVILGAHNQNGFVIGDGTEPTRGATGGSSIRFIDFNVGAGVALCTEGACVKINYAYNIHVDWCTIYGANALGARTLFHGVESSRGEEYYVINCEFYYIAGDGHHASGTGMGANRNIDGRIDNCKFINVGGDCVYFGPYCEGMTVNTPIAYAYDGDFLQINSTLFNFFLVQPNIEIGATSGGVYLQQGSAVQVVGGWFGGGTRAVFVDVGGSDVKVIGARLDQTGVEFRGPACTIQGCEITGPIGAGVGVTIGAAASDAIVTGNRIRQWATGVSLSGSPAGALIAANKFKNNTNNILGAAGSPSGSPAQVYGNAIETSFILAAAANLVLDYGRKLHQVTGATAITDMTLLAPDTVKVFQAGAGGITINNTATIALKGGVNAVVPQYTTITLLCDGQTWLEIGRSF